MRAGAGNGVQNSKIQRSGSLLERQRCEPPFWSPAFKGEAKKTFVVVYGQIAGIDANARRNADNKNNSGGNGSERESGSARPGDRCHDYIILPTIRHRLKTDKEISVYLALAFGIGAVFQGEIRLNGSSPAEVPGQGAESLLVMVRFRLLSVSCYPASFWTSLRLRRLLSPLTAKEPVPPGSSLPAKRVFPVWLARAFRREVPEQPIHPRIL